MAYKNKKNKNMLNQDMIFQNMKKKDKTVETVETHTTKLFTPMDLVNFCFAVYYGDTGTKESEYELDWEDFLDEKTVKLYEQLTPKEQNEFDQVVDTVLEKYQEDFRLLPANVDSKESFEKLESKKAELSLKVAPLMSEYIK